MQLLDKAYKDEKTNHLWGQLCVVSILEIRISLQVVCLGTPGLKGEDGRAC